MITGKNEIEEFKTLYVNIAAQLREKEAELKQSEEVIKELREHQGMSETDLQEHIALAEEENRNKTDMLSRTVKNLNTIETSHETTRLELVKCQTMIVY